MYLRTGSYTGVRANVAAWLTIHRGLFRNLGRDTIRETLKVAPKRSIPKEANSQREVTAEVRYSKEARLSS